MLKNILNTEGVITLNTNEKQSIKAGVYYGDRCLSLCAGSCHGGRCFEMIH
ncbi:hypothetical protein [Aquimarina sp. AU474]|uniref:hypothetical protein n=1 Tax=Aquimarina sp. AU474 TaxID=2108529 RepID=UPI001356CDAF|nr:hypothetical protein [Aquimarina sp. AU474]